MDRGVRLQVLYSLIISGGTVARVPLNPIMNPKPRVLLTVAHTAPKDMNQCSPALQSIIGSRSATLKPLKFPHSAWG